MIKKGMVRVGNSKNSYVGTGTDVFLNIMVQPTRFTRDREYFSLKLVCKTPVLQDYLNLEIR